MALKKILAAISVVAVLSTASGLAYAGEIEPLKKKQSQVFKTGQGVAAGQGVGGPTGGLSTGSIAVGIAAAAVLAVALAAITDDGAASTTTTTTTTTTTSTTTSN